MLSDTYTSERKVYSRKDKSKELRNAIFSLNDSVLPFGYRISMLENNYYDDYVEISFKFPILRVAGRKFSGYIHKEYGRSFLLDNKYFMNNSDYLSSSCLECSVCKSEIFTIGAIFENDEGYRSLVDVRCFDRLSKAIPKSSKSISIIRDMISHINNHTDIGFFSLNTEVVDFASRIFAIMKYSGFEKSIHPSVERYKDFMATSSLVDLLYIDDDDLLEGRGKAEKLIQDMKAKQDIDKHQFILTKPDREKEKFYRAMRGILSQETMLHQYRGIVSHACKIAK